MADPKIVEVEWLDTVSEKRWTDRIHTVKTLRPSHCVSYGLLLDDTEDYLMVAGSVDEHNDNVDHVDCIPKSAILKVTVLERAE